MADLTEDANLWCVSEVGNGLLQAKMAECLTQSQVVFGQVEVLSLTSYEGLHELLTISLDYAPVRPHGVYFFFPFPPIESKACLKITVRAST